MSLPRKRKRCKQCQKKRHLEQFYAMPGMTDGRSNKCIECTKEATKLRYWDNVDRARAYCRAKPQLEKQRRHRWHHPDRYKARTAVNNAIRDGRLKRQPCKVRGCKQKPQAHHKDYSRPLDVEWLCFRHHRELEHGQRTS